ncbi:hypothetical protein KDJ56_07065 [Brevibacillus composti]|uniref:Uncharacterized protein n=1 Tax=Brevibacillus composti TaxID=2796470 RepID=A0A7T5JQ26_9BACL|nr:hypothetical protein [Brevibacillus composti]QQE75192.1 hypothetical protein JD108_04480 [Brevibacillus composti]QQE75691.1 hypothetical protein JD108_07385 [Brevibacillus composti]QUO42717.1 hypothetical protein KDJ56_07065 [Brevibacillus composti]
MKYDFQAAERRIEELKLIYRQIKEQHQEDGTWDWWIMAQIEEIELEIEEAKRKMAVRQDGHPAKAVSNVITPIIPAWQTASKEVVQSGSL